MPTRVVTRWVWRGSRNLRRWVPSAIYQYARPDSDVTTPITWTGDGGETTNLYQRIDETPASDTDYIRSILAPSANVHEVGLSDVGDLKSSGQHIVRYRYRKQAAGDPVDLTVSLRQGNTQIAAWTESAIGTGWADGVHALSGAEADSITDYTDLRLRFSATQGAPATAPTYVASTTMVSTATSAATMSPGLPTGWAANDIAILVAHTSGNGDFSDTITGWTKITPGGVAENNTAAQRVEVWCRRLQGGDSGPTVPGIADTNVRAARVFCVRGCPTSGNAEDQFYANRSNNAASATITFPSVDATTTANTLSVLLYAYEDDPNAASTVTGFAAFDVDGTTTGTDAAMGADATRTNSGSGTLSGGTSTASGGSFANSVNVGLHFAFKPAATDARANVSWAELQVPAAAVAGDMLAPAGLGNPPAHGAATIAAGAVVLTPSGLGNQPGHGTPTTGATFALTPAGLGNAPAHGTPAVAATYAITPAGLANQPAAGGATVSPGAVSLTPSGLGNQPAFGGAAVSALATIAPAGLANAPAHAGATVAPGVAMLAPSGLGSAPATGQATVGSGAAPQSLAPAGLGLAVAHGTPTVAAGYAVAAGGLANAPGYGGATVAPGAATLTPSGSANQPAFGAALISSGGAAIAPDGLGNAPAFGTATIIPGAVTLTPPGIGNQPGHGTATVGATRAVTPSGLGNQPLHGTPSVAAGAAGVAPGGLANLPTHGTATIGTGAAAVTPAGLGVAPAYGNATVTATYTLASGGLAVAPGHGGALFTPGAAPLDAAGLGNQPGYGDAAVSRGDVIYLLPGGLANVAVVGSEVDTFVTMGGRGGGQGKPRSGWQNTPLGQYRRDTLGNYRRGTLGDYRRRRGLTE